MENALLTITALLIEETLDKNAIVEDLILTIANGDTASLGKLYDLIKTDVFAYALSKMGNKHDAEDVTQDTFVQVYKYAKQYKPKGKPMAWIITIELNLIRRQYQLKSRTVFADEIFQNTPNIRNFEESAINNAFLRELMRNLDKDEQEVIVLHAVWGMKHREIASKLEKPLSTILSKYNRAIKKLRDIAKENEA